MKNEPIKILNAVLKKLLISRPIEPKDRKDILKNRKKSLFIVMEKLDIGSFGNKMMVHNMLFSRKFKNRDSSTVFNLATATATLAILSIFILGTIYLYNRFTFKQYVAKRKTGAIVVFKLGSVSIKRNNINKPLTLNSVVKKNDIITTKNNSVVSLQLQNKAIFTISDNSNVKIISLIDKNNTTLFLKKGIIHSKVRKLKKNSTYQISTKTNICAVRGTKFTVYDDNNVSKVILSTGKLYVKHTKSNKERLIDNPKTAYFTKTIDIKETTKEEKILVEKMPNIPFIKNIEKVTIKDMSKQIKKIKDEYLRHKKTKPIENKKNASKKQKQTFVKKPLTLEDIKKKYKSLVKIKLKNGKSYIGAYTQSNKQVVIVTTKGKIYVKGEDIETVSPY